MHLQAKCWNTSYPTRLVGCKGKEAAVARSFAFVWLPWSSCIYSADLCAEWLVWKMSDIQVINKAALLWFKLCVCVTWCVFWFWQPLLSQSLILSCLHIIRWKGPFLYEYVCSFPYTSIFNNRTPLIFVSMTSPGGPLTMGYWDWKRFQVQTRWCHFDRAWFIITPC